MSGLYISSALVEKATNTISAMGGSIKTYSTRIAAMPCRLVKRTLRESDVNGKLSQINFWTVFCDYNSTNAAVLITDRITIGTKVLEVVGIDNAGGLKNHHFEIDCKEVE